MKISELDFICKDKKCSFYEAPYYHFHSDGIDGVHLVFNLHDNQVSLSGISIAENYQMIIPSKVINKEFTDKLLKIKEVLDEHS